MLNVIACKNCERTQVPTTPAVLDALQWDLEHDGAYMVVERNDAAGMLKLRSTETDMQPAFWMCAECLTRSE